VSQKKIQRALISVSNKQGIVEFATSLHALGIAIISTGGTCQLLEEANIPVIEVSTVTGFPEMMDGRLKTLHPKIHGGILGRRLLDADVMRQHDIEWIDLVVVNLYPFAEVIQNQQATLSDAIENIDIGGPAMIRSAAKNMADVAVIVDPADYEQIIDKLVQNKGMLELADRRSLAIKAFECTANYDALIFNYLHQTLDATSSIFPPQMHLVLHKSIDLRYGENPTQAASAYQFAGAPQGLFSAQQHQGKSLSYNNLLDANAAIACVREFDQPTCVIVKHANPCGVASDHMIIDAFKRAQAADFASSFGGIIALNRSCDANTAMEITASFFEVIIAPSYSEKALLILNKKPNLRVLTLPEPQMLPEFQYQGIEGGMLIQQMEHQTAEFNSYEIVTQQKISDVLIQQLSFAWRIVKHVKSNAILIAKDFQTIGIGAGQVSRIDAVNIALNKAGDHLGQSVLASDAFFPFRDSIDRIADSGVVAVIQPGGSIRDQEVIDACNEYGIAMMFTGRRCFKH